MNGYLPRWIAPVLSDALQANPVVVLSGARQVGKSTLLANEQPFSSWRYLTLDDLDVLEQARREPEALWAGASAVVIDEAQRAPGLLLAIKRRVDADRPSVRFVLSGSADLLVMRGVSETLAGRASYLRLAPFTLGELRGIPAPGILERLLTGEMPEDGLSELVDPHPYLLSGLMPPAVSLAPHTLARWWEGYAATYFERDLRQVSQIDAVTDFRHVMQSVALRSGSLLNQSDIARDLGISQPTVHRYLNALETTSVVRRVGGYAVSGVQRLAKRPKAYWFDAGAASFLCGLHTEEAVRSARVRGGLFEGLVLQHLDVLVQLLTPTAHIHYWRTASGTEVDFVVEHSGRLLPVEVKLTSRPGYDDAASLRSFMAAYPDTSAGLLVHAGDAIRRLDERIVAVPWTVLAGL